MSQGSVSEVDLVLSDVTTANSSTQKHGFLPKLDGSTSKFLRADGSWSDPGLGVYEPVLGNPATSGWILASTSSGTRYWVSQTGGVIPVSSTLLHWSGTYYEPFASKQSGGEFYVGTTTPDQNTRLNYNGYLYATQLYDGGSRVSVVGHTHPNYEDAGTVTAHASTLSGVHGLNITSGKVLSVENSLTLRGVNGSFLNIGTGGSLGTAAFVDIGAIGMGGISLQGTPAANQLTTWVSSSMIKGNSKLTFDDATGVLVVDGHIRATGEISAFSGNDPGGNFWNQMPTASTTQLGGVKIDGTSITINNGVISSSGGGGGGTWGSITGTLSNQTDLSNALAAKAPTSSPTFTGTATLDGTLAIQSSTATKWTIVSNSTPFELLIKNASGSIVGTLDQNGNLFIQGDIAAFSTTSAPPNWWDNLPVASATVLGGIKVGNNLTITNGVLSATASSLTFQQSIVNNSGTVNLVNDNATPGNSKLYGTDGSGTKGWYSIPNSMVYPGAGIAVSTGSAWGTSITDNSANWNTAYSWGNWAGHTHTLASATFANQGTTTQVLHGNASGNPSWGSIVGADFGSQTANYFFAAPNGSAGNPSFRAIVKGDISGTTAVFTDQSNTFTYAQTFRASNAIRVEAANTQDAIVIAGRAGGSSSYAITITPAVIGSNRTYTLPDANVLAMISSFHHTITGSSAARVYSFPDTNATLAALGVAQDFTAQQSFSNASGIKTNKIVEYTGSAGITLGNNTILNGTFTLQSAGTNEWTIQSNTTPFELLIKNNAGTTVATLDQNGNLFVQGDVAAWATTSSPPNWWNNMPYATTTTVGGVKIDGTTITINGSGVISSSAVSYTFSQSIQNNSGTITLVGDSASPGNSMMYGTNGSGTKGWYTVPSSMVYPSSGIPLSTGSAWNTSITPSNGWLNYNGSYSWTTPTLNDIGNPTADKQFAMTSRQLKFLWTNPTPSDGAMELEVTGNYSGDVLHIHQNTGSPGAGTDLLHLEATSTNVNPLRINGSSTGQLMTLLNPAGTYSYTLYSGAIGANRNLTLPAITGSDTLVSLGLAQTFSAQQSFSGGIKADHIAEVTGSHGVVFDNLPYASYYNATQTSGYLVRENTGSGYGIYKGASTRIGIAANGTEYLTILSTGNVGVGTTSPSYKLHSYIVGNTGSAAALIQGEYYGPYFGTSQTSSSYYAFSVMNGLSSTGTGGNSLLYVRADGNVGIGTTSPSSLLHIKGSSPELTIQGSNAGYVGSPVSRKLKWTNYLDVEAGSINLFDYNYDTTRTEMAFTIKNNSGNLQEAMRINYTGQISINTTVANSWLDVVGSANTYNTPDSVLLLQRPYNPGNSYTSAAAFMLCPSGSVNTRLDVRLLNQNRTDLGTVDTTVMTWLSNGNVGINSTNPAQALSVNGVILVESGAGYLYTYGRAGYPNSGKILFNNGTGANLVLREEASNLYTFSDGNTLLCQQWNMSSGEVKIYHGGSERFASHTSGTYTTGISYASGSFRTDTARPVIVENGQVSIKGETGTNALMYRFYGSSGSILGEYGALTSNDTLQYLYIGTYGTSPWTNYTMRFNTFASSDLVYINSGHAYGGYVAFSTSGTIKGYIGSRYHLEGATAGYENDIALRSNNHLSLLVGNGYRAIQCDNGGVVAIYYNATERFRTTSSGVTVTGSLLFDSTSRSISATGNGSSYISFGSDHIRFYYDAKLYNTLTFTDSLWNTSTGIITATKLTINGASGNTQLELARYGGQSSIRSQNDLILDAASATYGVYIGHYVGSDVYIENTGSYTTRISNGKVVIASSGAITSQGEITSYYTSDRNLKRDIIGFNGLDIIKKINPISFRWNEEAKKLNSAKDDRRNFGVIAQELEQHNPEFIHSTYQKYKGVDYVQLVPVLIQAMKEQQDIIEKQQVRLEDNESKINDLTDKLNRLEQLILNR